MAYNLNDPEIAALIRRAGTFSDDPLYYEIMRKNDAAASLMPLIAQCQAYSQELQNLQMATEQLSLKVPFDDLAVSLNSEEMTQGRTNLLQFLQTDLLAAVAISQPIIAELAVTFDTLAASIDNVWMMIAGSFGQILAFLQEFFPVLLTFASEQWQLLMEGVKIFGQGLGLVWNNLWQSSLNQFNFFRLGLTQGWQTAWGGLQEVASAGVGKIINYITSMVNNAIERINSFLNFVNQIGGSLGINLDWQIPKFENGGWVGKTGLAVVHEGEFVLSKPMLQGQKTTPFSTPLSNQITINATIDNQLDLTQIGQELLWQLQSKGY